MKRIKLTTKQLKALLKEYDCKATDSVECEGKAITYQSTSGLLVAVVFYNHVGDIKQVFIPDYVEKKCPTIANAPCAPARVQSHGTG